MRPAVPASRPVDRPSRVGRPAPRVLLCGFRKMPGAPGASSQAGKRRPTGPSLRLGIAQRVFRLAVVPAQPCAQCDVESASHQVVSMAEGWRVGVDEELSWALRAQKGDQQAFARIVEAYQTPVYNLAYRMLGSAGEAEDAAQETFLRVYTRLATYDPERKLSSWVLSVASHYCIDRLRRRRGGDVSMEQIQGWRWLPDERPQPEDRTVARERDGQIRQALACLPDAYRLVIVLRYWHDLSYDEIAEITGATESAVKSRLHRAREAVAEALTVGDSAQGVGAPSASAQAVAPGPAAAQSAPKAAPPARALAGAREQPRGRVS